MLSPSKNPTSGETNANPLHSKVISKVLSDEPVDLTPEQKAMQEQKKALSKAITSVSNFSVQYNFQAIAIALIVMSESVCTSDDANCKDGEQAEWVDGVAAATVFVGAIVGQLTMGYLGDVIGRSRALFFTLLLASFGAAGSSLFSLGSPTSIYAIIICFRFLLGIGAGGVYPLSATKAAEDSSKGKGKVNSVDSAKAFFWQAPGAMTPWIFAYFLTYSNLSVGLKWRLILGMGAVPALMVVVGTVLESRIEENMRIVRPSETKKATDGPTLWESLRDKKNIKKLIASGGGWFIYDVAYYGVNLFAGEILSHLTDDDGNVSSNKSVRDITSKQLIANSVTIPAVVLTIALMKAFGTKRLQVIGFSLISVAFILMAALFDLLKDRNPDLLFAFYCLLLFFLSFGTNVTTYVLSAELYSKDIRSTFNGISAALGKVGAAVGAYVFHAIDNVAATMIMCAVISVVGAVVSEYYIDIDDGEDTDYQPLAGEEKIDLETSTRGGVSDNRSK